MSSLVTINFCSIFNARSLQTPLHSSRATFFLPNQRFVENYVFRSFSLLEILKWSGFLRFQLQLILEPFLWKKSDSAVVSDANANER